MSLVATNPKKKILIADRIKSEKQRKFYDETTRSLKKERKPELLKQQIINHYQLRADSLMIAAKAA